MHKISFDLSFLDENGSRHLKKKSLSGNDEKTGAYSDTCLTSGSSKQDGDGESKISGFVILIIIICR